MAYQDKLDAALALIREHNDAVGEGNPGSVDEKIFVQSLKAFGATTEADLSELRWEEIEDLLCPSHSVEMPIKPKKLAQKIADTWRDGEEKQEDEKRPQHVSSKKAHRMSPRELLEAFDPEEPDSPVGNRLRSLSKGNPFLVYSSGRIVDVEASLTLLMEVKQGYPARQTYQSKRVYNIGDLPEAYAEENPLYPKRPLRPDGSCDQLNRSWAGIPTEVRQFVRVMLECHAYSVTQREDGHYILDLITSAGDAMATLRERYEDAAVEFDDRQKRNALPNLLVSLTPMNPVSAQGGGVGGPFEQGKQVQWFAPPSSVSNYYCSSADRGTVNQELARQAMEQEVLRRKFLKGNPGGLKIQGGKSNSLSGRVRKRRD